MPRYTRFPASRSLGITLAFFEDDFEEDRDIILMYFFCKVVCYVYTLELDVYLFLKLSRSVLSGLTYKKSSENGQVQGSD